MEQNGLYRNEPEYTGTRLNDARMKPHGKHKNKTQDFCCKFLQLFGICYYVLIIYCSCPEGVTFWCFCGSCWRYSVIPLCSDIFGSILVHSVSFQGHSASFRYIPFCSIRFVCLVTPPQFKTATFQ